MFAEIANEAPRMHLLWLKETRMQRKIKEGTINWTKRKEAIQVVSFLDFFLSGASVVSIEAEVSLSSTCLRFFGRRAWLVLVEDAGAETTQKSTWEAHTTIWEKNFRKEQKLYMQNQKENIEVWGQEVEKKKEEEIELDYHKREQQYQEWLKIVEQKVFLNIKNN